MANIWRKHGFRANPYDVAPIAADEEGQRLLVGRSKELAALETSLASSTTHPTLEGQNGVGKTSLVAVTGYRLRRAFEEGKEGQLLLPVQVPFQLDGSTSLDSFKMKVLLRICQEIIANEALLRRLHTAFPDIANVQRWLQTPLLGGGGGGITTPVGGGSLPTNAISNTSVGYASNGFGETVRGWLNALFPAPEVGAFVCVIDNLELLETSKAARELLEGLRDELFRYPGLRWVLCGARGIIRSVASSSRLQGVLGDPIEVRPIADDDVSTAIERRVEVYGSADSYVPVESAGFRHLYDVCNRNLRTAMKFAQDYAVWLESEDLAPSSPDEKNRMLEVWMAEMADQYERDSSSIRGTRAWQVFDKIAASGGQISPGDFEAFGFESIQAMRPHIKNLEEGQLLHSAVDDKDKRRKTIELSHRGWIVWYKRCGYRVPSNG